MEDFVARHQRSNLPVSVATTKRGRTQRALNESIRSTKFGGHLALIGVLTGPSVSDIVLPRVFMKQINISGIAMANRESQQRMFDYIDTLNFRQNISDYFMSLIHI